MSEKKKQTLNKQQNGNSICRAFFGDIYMGVIIDKYYNFKLKKEILTLRTTAGTVTKIGKSRKSKWNFRP